MSSTFYVVRHSFKLGQAEQWWKGMGERDADAMAAWHEATHKAGFHNHTFLPTGMTSNAYCVWEAKAGKTGADFQKFIDSELGPAAGGEMINECLPINLELAGSPPFPSFFASSKTEEAPGPVTADSSLFLIHHTFKSGKSEHWWNEFGKLASEPEKMAAFQAAQVDAGFYGHAFMPTGKSSDCYCLWEAKAGTTDEEMQAFIDGPIGPSFGCFSNAVIPIDLALCGGAPGIKRKFNTYTLTARFFAAEGKMDELVRIFKEVLPVTAQFDGCQLIEMYLDPSKPNEFLLWEKWDSQAHHARYMKFRTDQGFFDRVGKLFAAPPAIQPLRRCKDGEARLNVRASGFTVLAKFTAAEGRKEELLSTIAEALKCTHKYAGNRSMEQFTDDADPNAMYLWEQWDRKETFESYFKMRVDTGFIAQVMPMLAGPPAPMPITLAWQATASPRAKIEKAKKTDAKLRRASPHHAPAAAPLSPVNRRQG